MIFECSHLPGNSELWISCNRDAVGLVHEKGNLQEAYDIVMECSGGEGARFQNFASWQPSRRRAEKQNQRDRIAEEEIE